MREGTGGLVALLLERGRPARWPAWSCPSAAACSRAAGCRRCCRLMRREPSEVAATTGSVSSATRRVGDTPVAQGYSRSRADAAPRSPGRRCGGVGRARRRGHGRNARSAHRRPHRRGRARVPGVLGRGDARSVPPWGSGSAEALPSLLKRPCTSVATSGPGALPRERTDTVSAY